MRIPAERNAWIGVTEARLNSFDIDAISQKHGRLGMTKLMKLQIFELILFTPGIPPMCEVVNAIATSYVRTADRRLVRLLHVQL